LKTARIDEFSVGLSSLSGVLGANSKPIQARIVAKTMLRIMIRRFVIVLSPVIGAKWKTALYPASLSEMELLDNR